MNTVERTSPRSARLDRARPSSRVRGVSTDERFRGQDWKKLQAKLTTFAHHRTRRRSWELAQDLAGTDALQIEAWHVMYAARGKVGPFRVNGTAHVGGSGKVGVRMLLHDEGNADKAVTSAAAVFEIIA